ncbi:MAG: adenylyl-sulfate kinase [Candidatus Omnitrophica bacterium]|nr:adenylyl-sulfate kinase [Candidatus Omnitrophota bacterium]
MSEKKIIENTDRMVKNGHRAGVIWLTGLSGAGKSTIAYNLEKELFAHNVMTYVLDGDILRAGLSSDLGYTMNDRLEHLRRTKEVVKLFYDAGFIVIGAFISPLASIRQDFKESFKDGDFLEVFVDCPLEECEKRDPKGLYARFRQGEILDFTGISSSYEKPLDPEIHIKTNELLVEECVGKIIKYLIEREIIYPKIRKYIRSSGIKIEKYV